MSDVSKTNELIAGLREHLNEMPISFNENVWQVRSKREVREAHDRATIEHQATRDKVRKLLDALATRVPVQGEPNACLDHKPVQHRDGKPPWCNACGRATVPDAATENVQKMYDRACADIQEYSETIKRLQAERDAALAAVERVTAERDSAMARIAKAWELHEPFTWSFGYGPVQSCKWCADNGVSQEVASWPCPTVAALDGAPEPEWDYCFAEIHDDGEIYTNGPDEGLQFATAEDARAARIEESDVVMKRVKGVPAGPWLPVEGESKP